MSFIVFEDGKKKIRGLDETLEIAEGKVAVNVGKVLEGLPVEVHHFSILYSAMASNGARNLVEVPAGTIIRSTIIVVEQIFVSGAPPDAIFRYTAGTGVGVQNLSLIDDQNVNTPNYSVMREDAPDITSFARWEIIDEGLNYPEEISDDGDQGRIDIIIELFRSDNATVIDSY